LNILARLFIADLSGIHRRCEYSFTTTMRGKSKQSIPEHRACARCAGNPWSSVMMRKMLILLASIAAVTTGSIAIAAAHGGGGGGHGGFAGIGGGGHFAIGHPGGFSGVAGPHSFGIRGDRFGFRRGPLFRDHFAFFGGYPYPYYYDSCYSRAWTPWGWRSSYVCY
jgi:hypothetical protein